MQSIFSQSGCLVGIDLPSIIRIKYLNKVLNYLSSNYFIPAHCQFPSHIKNMLIQNNYKKLLIIGNPRDVVISKAYYILKSKVHPLHKNFVKTNDILKILDYCIYEYAGEKYCLDPIVERIHKIEGWINDKSTCVVHFENRIGVEGGGNYYSQKNEVQKVMDFLNVDIKDKNVENICQNLFGNINTLRKGKIMQWEDELSVKHINYFKDNLEDFLVDFGYKLS